MKTNDLNFILKVLYIFKDIDCQDDLWWYMDSEKGPVSFSVNCNDLFYWACADSEDITPDNIELLEQTIRDIRARIDNNITMDRAMLFQAPILFVARVRKMRPQGAAYGYINSKIWDLFDACGPERGNEFGNTPKPDMAKLQKWEEDGKKLSLKPTAEQIVEPSKNSFYQTVKQNIEKIFK
jgi:hypothetical protein